MDAQERTKLYANYLAGEDNRPQVDSAGNIVFKFEGSTYVIIVDKNDPEYFCLMYPNFWPINSPEEQTRAHIAAGTANRGSKVVKVLVDSRGEGVTAVVEGFYDQPEQSQPIFGRALRVLKYGVQVFVNEMLEG